MLVFDWWGDGYEAVLGFDWSDIGSAIWSD